MKKIFRSFISILLCIVMLSSSVTTVFAQQTDDMAEIVSTTMETDADSSNMDKYYFSEDDWEKDFPDGLFVVEYDSYGVYEGGSDPENPEDIYLGIVIYRLGGNNYSDTVTFYLTGISADSELYPDSMGTVEFEPQQLTATAKVKIINDDVRKGDQLILFTLENAEKGVISKSSSAVITVTDDEPYVESKISLSVNDTTIDKSQGGAEIVLRRTENIAEYSTLTLYTSDGTATAGVDYEAVEKEIVFAPGESERIVTIPFIQTNEKFTQPKNFKVSLKDMKGSKAFDSDSIRVDFTNTLSDEAKQLIEVTDSADFQINDTLSLVERSQSVMNKNDTLDRTQMLKAGIGSANGTAVQAKPEIILSSARSSKKWSPYLYVPASEFYQVYSDGSSWTAGSQYNDGNQNLMIASKNTYNLNHFTELYYSFDNHRVALNGRPNTAIGYFWNDGSVYSEDKFDFVEGSLHSSEDSFEYKWTLKNHTYILQNYNNTDVNYEGGEISDDSDISSIENALKGTYHVNLNKLGLERYEGSAGMDGAEQSLFFMLYDDEGWDDHHFRLGYVVLKRDIIPFSIFRTDDLKEFTASETGISFIKDGYKWTVTTDGITGGIGTIDSKATDSADKYGFYAGSMLKFTVETTAATGQAIPIPEYIYFVDDQGVVHNSANGDGTGFTIPLETVMSKDLSLLENVYYMTEEEAKLHATYAIEEDRLISSKYEGKINLKISYTMKHSIKLNYSNVPVLVDKATTSNGELETNSQYEQRLLSVLNGVLEFYLNGEEVTPHPIINSSNKELEYSSVEFDYIRVTPSAMGVGAIVTSNLADIDYVRIESSLDISNEVCKQTSSDITFNVLSEKTTYLNPTIKLESVGVSKKVDGKFETFYVANPIDRTIPFEVLYSDTSAGATEISYYKMEFFITDIYFAGATNCEEKDFDVTVYHSDTSSDTLPLFEFTFTGGKAVNSVQNVELKNLDSAFTKNDGLNNPGVDVEGFKPVVRLAGLSSAGYKYEMYIPTYYCYTQGGGMSPYYETVFGGSDGVRIEITEAESESDGGKVLYALDMLDTQYVCQQIPKSNSQADSQEAESPYSDVQQEFYTYRENCVMLTTPNFNIDTTNFPLLMTKLLTIDGALNDRDNNSLINGFKMFAGSGVYVKFNNDQITLGAKIAWSGGDSFAKKPAIAADSTASPNKKAVVNTANSRMVNVTGSLMLDTSVQLVYNTLSHRYEFSKFSVSFSGSVGVLGTIPLSVPVIYVTISTNLALTLATGCQQVLNYVDHEGTQHYKILWSGLAVTPSFNLSIGIGFGLSGILSFEFAGSADIMASVAFGTSVFSPAQKELDIHKASLKKDVYQLNYTGNWSLEETQSHGDGTDVSNDRYGYGQTTYAYNGTLQHSKSIGDKLVITTNGTSFQLTGVTSPSGAVMDITVSDANTKEVYKNNRISTYSSKTRHGVTLFNWSMENYQNSTADDCKNIIVTIEHVLPEGNSAENYDKELTLDSILVYNPQFYVNTMVPAQFQNFYFKLAISLKLTLLFLKFTIEPAYMQINVTEKLQTITLGTIGYSVTFDVTARKALRSSAADADVPLVMASEIKSASTMHTDYFNTGEYGSEKEKVLLAGDISSTAGTQAVYHNGKVYTFYSVMGKDDQGKFSYQLYCSVDGAEKICVNGNDPFVSQFYAFEDADGNLVVEMITADSTISHFTISENNTFVMHYADSDETLELSEGKDVSELYKRTCVKVAVFDESTSSFPADKITVVGNTDGNGKMESIPAASDNSSTGNSANVLFYVVDEETTAEADYNINFSSRVEEIASGMATTKELYDAIYNGRNELYAVVYKDGKIAEETVVRAPDEVIPEVELKPGYKIMEVVSLMADADTVCVAYNVEIPYVTTYGQTGTLKQLNYRTGTVNDDGNISFDEKIVVESIMDYDKGIDTFADDSMEFSSRYYNPETGEYYSTIYLCNLQMKNANLCNDKEDPEKVTDEPCLFYQTNASVNCVTYSAIKSVQGGETDVAIESIYDDYFDNFVVAVSETGNINLIYSDSSDYTDTLYYLNYDSEKSAWIKPRRLTYADVFDREAYENYESTASLMFDNFDAYVNDDGEVTVVLRSSYIPFTYNYGTDSSTLFGDASVDVFSNYDYEYLDEDGKTVKGVITPLQDYESQLARSDIFRLTFKDPVTDLEVTNFNINNKIFVKGQNIDMSFVLENVGDTTLENIKVQLFYQNVNSNSPNIFMSQDYSGKLYAGDSVTMNFEYVVDDYISDNSLIGVMITSGRTVLYNSFEDSYERKLADSEYDNITYHIIKNSPELVINSSRVDIDANGIMRFTVNVKNEGTLAANNDAVLYCKVYDGDSKDDYAGTLFTYTLNKDDLKVGSVASVINQIDVSSWLVDEKLYYNFEIKTQDEQFDTENDSMSITYAHLIPEIDVNSVDYVQARTSSGAVRYNRNLNFEMKLGEEVVFETDVLSEKFDISNLRAYEIGTDCISIDKSVDGIIKIKAIALPDGKEGYVKLLLHLKDTSVYKYVYIKITNTDFVDFNENVFDDGWTLSGQDHVYAINFDLACTETTGSEINFNFFGDKLEILGDKLTNGGDFELTITDSDGNVVESTIVSTDAEKNAFGKVLYSGNELGYGEYSVKIKAVLDFGEKLSLDRAKYCIDASSADTTPYAVVNDYSENLDAPLVNGRERQARFTLNFSHDIKLAEGVELSDITLEFAEYESDGGEYIATGETVTFTAVEINGKQLVLTAPLSSKQGYVMKYVLNDTNIPEGVVTDTSGNAVNTLIPDSDMVSYILKESGILSVTVADDSYMPDGSVHKSVHVKFMVAPDISRLKGTKILYRTTDADGNETAVEFKYACMSNDPRVAVYRAGILELDKEEMSKIFSYERGIVLNGDCYVLVTADGDYLDNEITTVINSKSELDIIYTKTKAENTFIKATVANGIAKPYVYVSFENQVDISDVTNNAYVVVKEISEKDGNKTERELVLSAASLELDGKTVKFATDKGIELNNADSVKYELLSREICYYYDNMFIVTDYDKIAVNPDIDGVDLEFNTKAFIESASPVVSESGELSVSVVFSALVSDTEFEDTTLNVTEYVQEYKRSYTDNLSLQFISAENIGGKTVATYKYAGAKEIALGYNDVSKKFVVENALYSNSVITADNGVEVVPCILAPGQTEISRLKAQSGEITLIENADGGYHAQLILNYPEKISMYMEDTVYAQVEMSTGLSSEILNLKLTSVSENSLIFVTQVPFTLESGKVTTFTATERFVDALSSVVDSKGVGVSESMETVGTLVVDNSYKGKVQNVSVSFENCYGDTADAVARVQYNEILRELSFENSKIESIAKIIYEDGTSTAVAIPLIFDSLDGDNVAVYRAELDVPQDAVKAELILGERITPTETSPLYNVNKTLFLDKELPKTDKAKVEKISAEATEIVSEATGEIDNLSDVTIIVTYPENVLAENNEGISIKAKIDGFEGVNEAEFVLSQVYNNDTLMFKLKQDINQEHSNIVTITLDNAKIMTAEGSELYHEKTGLSVNRNLHNVSQTFVMSSGETPDNPDVPEVPTTPDVPEVPTTPDVPEVPTTPDVPEVPTTPDVPEVPTTPDVPEVPTKPDVPETPTIQDDSDTTTEENIADTETTHPDIPNTGIEKLMNENMNIVYSVALFMIVSLVIVLMLTRKKHNKKHF